MQGEPAEPPSPEESDPLVLRLQQQMARLKRWFAWELWLLEPRSFAPPDDPLEDELHSTPSPDGEPPQDQPPRGH